MVASHSVRKMRLDLGPAADGLQVLLEAAAGEDPPGGGRVLVLGEPDAAFALGPRGDQVPEPQPHLAAVADGAFRDSGNIGVPGTWASRCRLSGRRDEMAGVAAVLGGLGPGVFRLGEVVLAVQRHPVAEGGRAQAQLDVRTPSRGS